MKKLFLSSAVAISSAVLASGASMAVAAVVAPHFQIDRVGLPGEGRGDYVTVDPQGRRLYVTHSSAVHILDLDTLKPVAAVDGLKAAHGVALDMATGHGFVSDGEQNAVVMFDAKTGQVIKTIPTGQKPDSILRDDATGKIFVFNGDSEDVSVIDPATASVVGSVKLPHGPEFSQADGKGKIWVNMEEGNNIGEIDSRTMTLVRTIDLPGCDGPAPLAFDAVNRVLFSGCGNKVMTVTDADSGKVLTTVPIGGDPDGITFDPELKRVYVANRDGGWTIVDQLGKNRYKVNQTLKIDEYAKTIALDPKSHRLFSSTADLVWPPAVPGKKHLPNAKSGTFRLLVVSQK
ncbi:MAG TPA: YncE family protein [Sphingomonas sp.]|nr:YncE family protein [Sphingomonas sp.]